jgi:hypothetical protein
VTRVVEVRVVYVGRFRKITLSSSVLYSVNTVFLRESTG